MNELKKHILFFLLFKLSNSLIACFEERMIFGHSASLAEAQVASFERPANMYYNPSTLFSATGYNFTFSHTNPYNIDFLSDLTFVFTTNINNKYKLGFLNNYFGYENYKENKLFIGIARVFPDGLSLGLNLKNYNLTIKDYGFKNLIDYDIGAIKIFDNFSLGISLKNILHSKICADEYLKQEIVMGLKIFYFKKISTYIDFSGIIQEKYILKVGQELCLNFSSFDAFLRLGLQKSLSNFNNKISYGFGIFYKNLVFDYAYVIHPYLSSQHLFSIEFRCKNSTKNYYLAYEKYKIPLQEKLNINTADILDLKKAGFSTFDAKNILRYKNKFGKFNSLDQLFNVPNINKKIINNLLPFLIIE